MVSNRNNCNLFDVNCKIVHRCNPVIFCVLEYSQYDDIFSKKAFCYKVKVQNNELQFALQVRQGFCEVSSF